MTDFTVNAAGTLVLLCAHCPHAPFLFLSTNKVYGDTPNRLPLVECGTRWEVAYTHHFAEHGIDETMIFRHEDGMFPRGLPNWIGPSRCAAAWVSLLSMRCAVIIPARNERENLRPTITALVAKLDEAAIKHEIIVVDDHSEDDTAAELVVLQRDFPTLRHISNQDKGGFGLAVRAGLDSFRGDRVAVVMADGSDDRRDVLQYHRKIDEGRFAPESTLVDYPYHKLILNRLANLFLRLLFRLKTNDVTNAFKCYRRTVIAGLQPIFSHHFQSHRRVTAQSHNPWVFLRRGPNRLVQPQGRVVEAKATHSRNGEQIPVHRPCAEKPVLASRRPANGLPARRRFINELDATFECSPPVSPMNNRCNFWDHFSERDSNSFVWNIFPPTLV
jgi:dolichol-phosphate mannosyltransferase